ncbi:MAG: M20 family metallo-hydrolase [Alicyclobacillus sp.]|nr:M20 family metallo-hydrolase [Alicyclobacillus sp.]
MQEQRNRPQVRPTFNRKRFEERFHQFSQIGLAASGAVNRPFGSEADLEARSWLRSLAESARLHVQVDPVGNIWATKPGKWAKPAIVLGSHHDSVPDGGRFDGALGVLMAIEVIQSLAECGYDNAHPLICVSFTAEEPNPFELSTLGSRSVAGRLALPQLEAARDWNGRPLRDAIALAGGDLDQFGSVRKSHADIAAFLELHIEQGRRLEQSGIPIGVVTAICGIYRETITVTGEANHAGTTQLADRRDALLASSEMLLYVERLLKELNNPELIATVGRLTVIPNATNIIPGQCRWTLEIRGGDMAQVYAFRDRCFAAFAELARLRQVSWEHQLVLDQQPQPMAPEVVETLRRSAVNLGIPYLELASMAGHDATHMASFTRAGMVFVPSIGGKSHCKEEESRMEDIELAFHVLADSAMSLDSELAPEEEQVHETTV